MHPGLLLALLFAATITYTAVVRYVVLDVIDSAIVLVASLANRTFD